MTWLVESLNWSLNVLSILLTRTESGTSLIKNLQLRDIFYHNKIIKTLSDIEDSKRKIFSIAVLDKLFSNKIFIILGIGHKMVGKKHQPLEQKKLKGKQNR